MKNPSRAMSAERRHSPLPWKATKDCLNVIAIECFGGEVAQICNPSGGLDDADWDDARFIVTACNAHDKLVEALKAIRKAALNHNVGLNAALKLADQALAKPKGTR